jgi:hypothetical protein
MSVSLAQMVSSQRAAELCVTATAGLPLIARQFQKIPQHVILAVCTRLQTEFRVLTPLF